MSAIQQFNHNVRHLGKTNKFLQVPKDTSVINPQQFSSHVRRHSPLSHWQGGPFRGRGSPLLTPCSHWGCGRSSSRDAHAAPYNQLIHPLVGRHPSRSPTLTQSVGPYMLHPTGSGHALGASRWWRPMDGEAAASGLGRGCGVPDWVCDCCSGPRLRPLPALLQIVTLLYAAFQTKLFFVSKLSLWFPGCCLIQLIAAILLSAIS